MNLEPETRTCNKCGKEFPLTTEYYNYNKHRNQYRYSCHTCRKASNRQRWYDSKNKPKKGKVLCVNCAHILGGYCPELPKPKHVYEYFPRRCEYFLEGLGMPIREMTLPIHTVERRMA